MQVTSSRRKILVVEDDAAMREVLKLRLEQWGYRVQVASDGRKAREAIDSFDPDAVVSDVIMPEISGLDLLGLLKGTDADRPVILITANGTVDLAVEAMKAGASDFLTKPLDYSKLKSVLRAAIREVELCRDSRQLASQLMEGFGPFVGTSRPMREAYELIESIAGSDSPVLITGESGTGKELAARTIHEGSQRRTQPFVAINAAAIPSELMESELFGHEKGAFTGATARRKGCFEQAHRGTLLLDEIVEMSPNLQVKLLRILEESQFRRLGGRELIGVDVRVLAATNRAPRQAVADKQLREDLYYRLNVFTLELPPLRERLQDLPLLAQHFISQFNRKHGSSVEGVRPEALELMQSYRWPGNVRELRNIIERAVVLSRERWIKRSHLPPYLRDSSREEQIVLPPGVTASEAEKQLIMHTLEQTGNNKSETARRLGLDVKTIRNKLKSYGVT